MKTYYTLYPCPVEDLLLMTDGEALTGLFFHPHDEAQFDSPDWLRDDSHPVLVQAAKELREYFAGERTAFEVPLSPSGTDFQKRVWMALRDIPYGETITYGELARRIGNANASRAVGLANGRNPLSIIVPCHRVIGASGSLTGYGGGLERKLLLLELERKAFQLVS